MIFFTKEMGLRPISVGALTDFLSRRSLLTEASTQERVLHGCMRGIQG